MRPQRRKTKAQKNNMCNASFVFATASILIHGGPDHRELERALGTSVDNYHRGEPIPGPPGFASTQCLEDICLVKAQVPSSRPLKEHLDWLAVRLTASAAYLEGLAAHGARLELIATVASDQATTIIEIEPPLARLLVDLRLPLKIRTISLQSLFAVPKSESEKGAESERAE